jgi:hypothetical protein
MEPTGMEKYAPLMQGVKLRIELIERLMQNKDSPPLVPRFEFAALQFRKILELIAFGSLVANEKVYASTHVGFANEWNAKRLLVKVERLNPNFYPVPVRQVKCDLPGITFKHQKITSGFLTKDDFVAAYQKCSELIHTTNPYSNGNNEDFRERSNTFATWRNQIIKLLNLHELHLFDDPGMAVCSMNAGGTNKVMVYRFSPPGYVPGVKP